MELLKIKSSLKLFPRNFFIVAIIFGGISSPLGGIQPAFGADPKAASGPTPSPAGGGTDFGFRCEADIFYIWKRVPKTPAPLTEREPGGRPAAPAVEPPPEEPIEVFFNRIGERGAAEKSAHERLERRLAAALGEAMSQCRAEHENRGKCIADGVRRAEDTYQNADYIARKAITQGIKDDCETSAGRCLSTKNGPITCDEDRPPEIAPAATAAPTPTPAAAAAPPPKDDGKGKKK